MFLNASAIQAEVESGQLVIEPFLPDLLKPASYVLRAGRRHRTWKRANKEVVIWQQDAAANHVTDVVDSDELRIDPGSVVLLSSLESIALPAHLLAMIMTMSHLARFGLSCQLGSGLVSPGFGSLRKAALTLELVSFNPNPIRLRSGVPLCHLMFASVQEDRGSHRRLGNSIYEVSELPPQPPLLYEEFGGILILDQ